MSHEQAFLTGAFAITGKIVFLAAKEKAFLGMPQWLGGEGVESAEKRFSGYCRSTRF
jgi:hypothetical protein